MKNIANSLSLSQNENTPFVKQAEDVSCILFFVDGIGIGLNDREINPFARYRYPHFSVHGGGDSLQVPGRLVPVDATLGVQGIPQSATGQTALFTGYNGAKICGRHVSGFPSYSLRPYLLKSSLLKIFKDNGLAAALLNAYRLDYLEKLKHPRALRLMSATTLMNYGAENYFFTLQDFLQQKSLYMDITGWYLKEQGLIEEEISARSAGRRLVRLSRNYRLAIFEYFLTDKVGHDGSMQKAEKILRHLADFLEGIWEELDTEKQLLIVTSDHGNFEDFSVGGHTLHAVGNLLYGKDVDHFADHSSALYDVARSLFAYFGLKDFYKGFE